MEKDGQNGTFFFKRAEKNGQNRTFFSKEQKENLTFFCVLF